MIPYSRKFGGDLNLAVRATTAKLKIHQNFPIACIRIYTLKLAYYQLQTGGTTPTVSLSLHIGSDFTWRVYYYGVEVLVTQCPLLSDLSSSLSCASAVKHLFIRLSSCIGNPDERFLTLRSLKNGVLHGVDGKVCTVPAFLLGCYYHH